MRQVLAIALVIGLMPAITHAQTDVALLAFGVPTGVDVVKALGCKTGANPSVNNAEFINAALTNRAHRYAFVLPGDRMDITESIVVPDRTSIRLLGANGPGRLWQESMYTGSGRGGQTPRIVATGDLVSNAGTMIYVTKGAWDFGIDGLMLQGTVLPEMLPNGLPADQVLATPRAKIGIHYDYQGSGNGSALLSAGFLNLSCLDIGVNCGPDTDTPDENSNSDTTVIHRLVAQQVKKVFKVTQSNSINHVHNYVHYRANPGATSSDNTVYHFLAGGNLECRMLGMVSNGTVLRLGNQGQGGSWYKFDNVNIDGSVTDVKLVVAPTAGASTAYVEMGGNIHSPADLTSLPLIEARGSCYYVFRGFKGLPADSVKFVTNAVSGVQRHSTVKFVDCVFHGNVTSPEDLVESISGNASSCHLIVRNCTRAQSGSQVGEQIENWDRTYDGTSWVEN
jgi:hypothetical protein